MVLVIREILGYAVTAREAIRIIKEDKVKVDGRPKRDHRFSVGLMDVIQIQGAGHVFRVLPKKAEGLSLRPIAETEVGYKLCRITGKRAVDGKTIQLSLHDGRNFLVQPREGQRSDDKYELGGAVQLAIPVQKILRYIPFQPGVLGLATDGRNQGLHGKIASISPGSYAGPKIVRVETGGGAFETPAHYVIPVGTENSVIGLEN